MSKMIVLGAGIVGRAAAWDLARRGHDVTVADQDPGAAERVGSELDIDHTTADGAGKHVQRERLVLGSI